MIANQCNCARRLAFPFRISTTSAPSPSRCVLAHSHLRDLALATATSGLLLLAPPHPALASDPSLLRGPARIVDGDTLYIGQEKIRLYGVDAPEKGQQCNDNRGQPYACGLISKDKLMQKVGTKPVVCETKQRDQYQRTIAVCSLDGPIPEDLNGWLVQNGLAVAYREYSKAYVATEDAAHSARKGMWNGTFQYPADWRKAEKAKGSNSQGLPVAAVPRADIAVPYVPPPAPPALTSATKSSPAAQANPCGQNAPIKGNISSKGEKIYHVPGSSYYERVAIELAKGEKCFASEVDAAKEGFRPAGR